MIADRERTDERPAAETAAAAALATLAPDGADLAPVSNQATLLTDDAREPAPVGDMGPGFPLDPQTRQRMESVFGESFASVRVHAGSEAGDVTRRHAAQALTVGKHIAFAPGNYRPGTPVGDAMLAHELAHTIQQGGAPAATEAAPSAGPAGAALESDAELATAGAMRRLWGAATQATTDGFRSAQPALRSGLRVQRCSCGGAPPPVAAGATGQSGDTHFTDRGTKQALTAPGVRFDPAVPTDGGPALMVRTIRPFVGRATVWIAGGQPAEARNWSAGFTQTVLASRRVTNYRSADGTPAIRYVSVLPRPALDGDGQVAAPWADTPAAFTTSPSSVQASMNDTPGLGGVWDDGQQHHLASTGGRDSFATWLTVRHSGSRDPVYLTWDTWEVNWQADADFVHRRGIEVEDQGARNLLDGTGRGNLVPVLQPPLAKDLMPEALPEPWNGQHRE